MLSRDFLLAGKAIFTAQNPQGEYYTFRVSKPDERAPFFVSLLTGPDNENSFTYLGVLDPMTGDIRTTRASKFTPDSKPVRVANWATHQIIETRPLKAGYQIRHEGKCGVCGRKLTTPESLDRGIGPECAQRMGF